MPNLTKHAMIYTSNWKSCTHKINTNQTTFGLKMKQWFKWNENIWFNFWLNGVHVMFTTPSLIPNSGYMSIVLLMQ
jgi:hypothetical protein